MEGSAIPPLDINGLTVSDSQEKANAINTQFLSVHIILVIEVCTLRSNNK